MLRSVGLLLAIAPVLAISAPRIDASGNYSTSVISLEGVTSVDALATDGKRVFALSGEKNALVDVDPTTGSVGAEVKPLLSAHGRRKANLPTAVAVMGNYAFVASRVGKELCALELTTHRASGCVDLPGAPTDITAVPMTSELWVTTPDQKAITLVRASRSGALTLEGLAKVEGTPRAQALDPVHGVFYVGLSDKDRVVALDVQTHQDLWTLPARCGKGGAKALAVDADKRLLFIGCPSGVFSRNMLQGRDVGEVQNLRDLQALSYDPGSQLLYALSPGDLVIEVLASDAKGALTSKARLDTTDTAHVAVPASGGQAFIGDRNSGQLTWAKPVQ